MELRCRVEILMVRYLFVCRCLLLPEISAFLATTKLSIHQTSFPQPLLVAAATNSESQLHDKQFNEHQCDNCQATFKSRNALFRHIKFDCTDAEPIPVRHSVALFFGYIGIDAEAAGRVLVQSFLTKDQELMSVTQASVSKQRHPLVQQEDDCPSGMDTLIVNFSSANSWNIKETSAMVQRRLLEDSNAITLHGMRELETKWYLHAEQQCTQHVYHYMVPISWLTKDNSDYSIVDWYHRSVVTGNRSQTPSALKRFKEIFRRAESVHSTSRVSEKRFGALAHKTKRFWHNYADPDLRVSPNHDVSLRALDRARFADFVLDETNNQLFIIYEFSGDAFLPQQVRRIVGTAIAELHGWLPNDFVETSLEKAVVVETPLAPAGYMYQAGSRFHYTELSFQGKKLFDVEGTFRTTDYHPLKWIRKNLLSHMDASLSDSWLKELQITVTPRINTQLQELKSATILPNALDEAPMAYLTVLMLLRDIVDHNQWPSTSAARSSVIGSLENPSRAGSFTVVDAEKFDVSSISVPQANLLFPDLSTAVFELQQTICPDKETSSHCAVNSRAQFTPHVDSGRGKGQSVSTIVGLGDYMAGEIVVEGVANSIRYQPLQFDGWKMRHWTRPFSGERFSLVWFTPEGVDRKKS